jgi:beta-N-acetylglucosaminidase
VKKPLTEMKSIPLFCIFLMVLSIFTPVTLVKAIGNNLPSLVSIDTPQGNSKISNNTLYVAGWSLNSNGVKSVQVSIDGKNSENASIGVARPDVARVYPQYNGAQYSGYGVSLNISQLSNGTHTITVTSNGNDGSSKSQDLTIYKVPADGKNLAGITCIDTPTKNSNIFSVNNEVNVGGWSVDGYGIQKVQVYVDNTYMGDANLGVSRPDVGNVLPQYPGSASSGYNYSLNISNISDGIHTITVKSIGNEGSVSSNSVSVKKVSSQTIPPIVCIDTPNYSQVTSNQLYVCGWSLDLYGVQKVQVYVDNTYKGDASIGGQRADVNSVYPGYTGGVNSGYSYNLDVTALSTGIHTVTVESIGNDGSTTSKSAQIYKLANSTSSMSPMACIDTPSDGTFYKSQPGQVYVAGWSLNAFGVQKVQVYFDNSYEGDANIGGQRSDVNNVYPGYTGGANSGFGYNLNLSNISDGAHTISVKSIGNDGNVETQNSIIYKFSYDGQSTLYNLTLQDMVNIQMQNGQPVMESGNSWVSADSATVQHYVDPMNFMDNYGIYQFLRLDYMQGVTVDELNSILSGKGVLAGKGEQFLDAAQQNNINPIYLVSHALLETGNGTSQLATGIVVNGKTTYDLFGIGAYDSNPNEMGSEYAFNQGWFSVDDAIAGGAQWISSQYINNSSYKQDTLYKMRWNPASPGNHQYATDVSWAYNQIANIKTLINEVQNPVMQFDVPQYK